MFLKHEWTKDRAKDR